MQEPIVNGLFGLAGAVVGVAGTWWVTHRYHESKRLQISQYPVAQLLGIGKEVRPFVEVRYKGQLVDNLGASRIAVFNSGRSPIEDVVIQVAPAPEAVLLDVSIETMNFNAPAASITLQESQGTWELRAPFLNANDRLVLECKVIGNQRNPIVTARMIGVDIDISREDVDFGRDIYAAQIMRTLLAVPLYGTMLRQTSIYRRWKDAHEQEASQK